MVSETLPPPQQDSRALGVSSQRGAGPRVFELPCQQCWWASCSMSAVLVGFKLRIRTCPCCCQAGQGLWWPFEGTGWAGGYSAAGLQGFGLLMQGRGLVSLLSGRRDNKKVFLLWKQAALTECSRGSAQQSYKMLLSFSP